jgi:hypothetical protein
LSAIFSLKFLGLFFNKDLFSAIKSALTVFEELFLTLLEAAILEPVVGV